LLLNYFWALHFLPRAGSVKSLVTLRTAFFTATMLCLIALMDNPYRGELSVSPEAFQLIYDGLMKKPAI
jgi:hypothetical protein